MMKFSEHPQFTKEFKRLARKYPSLENDMVDFRRVVETVPLGNGKHFAVLIYKDEIKIIKARLFCRYLKGAVLRIVYAFCATAETIEFIELYPKNEKPREDDARIKEYLKDKL
jgi:hypothetical protein